MTTAFAMAVLAACSIVQSAQADAAPKVLMIMVDGLRADAMETQYMPNLAKLRRGEWQSGYSAAWSLTAQIAPGAAPSSAPNHVSIATGVPPSKHGVTANGETSGGDYATYPTWLKRVVDADSSKSALFLASWSEDADLGPDANVTTNIASDAENAASLAATLASANAPDAIMYFIDLPDSAGEGAGFYPMSDLYRSALLTTDGYIGACLDAIANRSTFANEDWLILVTSDHGGYGTAHGSVGSGRQAHTVPLVIAGKSVTAGRIPGMPYNMDVAASALAHFGVTAGNIDAVARDNTAVAEPSRTLADGLIAYMTFDSTVTENSISGSSVSPTSRGSIEVAANGKFGSYVDFPADTGTYNFVYLAGSESGYEGGEKCFTATLWVKLPATVTGDPVILANKDWASGLNKGLVFFAGSGSVAFNAGTGSSRIDIGPMVYDGTDDWMFYAITGDSDGVLTLYQGRKDGTLDWVCDSLPGYSMASGAGFCIGNDPMTGNYAYPFVGGVDDLGAWTRTLTQDEIRQIYSAGRAGISLGTLANASAGPATATWTGSVSSDATVAGNWSGNEVPTLDTAVTVSGNVSMTLAEGATLPCKSILFNNVTLGADANLRGIDATKIAPGSSINLNGHALYLRAGCSMLLSVTDSSADTTHPGELHLDDTGVDVANTTMSLSGNMRFFKSGAGKFTSSASETYTGSFAVEGGTFVMARDGSGEVYVGAGATLDTFGFDLKDCRHVTLAGGTITSTKDGANTLVSLCASMDVTADSSIVIANLSWDHDMTVGQYAWNLGGNTLAFVLDGYDPDLWMEAGGTMSNGTFRVVVMPTAHGGTGRAWMHFANLNGRDGLNLDLGTSILRMKDIGESTVNSKVCDFTCNPPPNEWVYSYKQLEVYGTFTPQSQDGLDLLMMDGSAIDLSAHSAPWDCRFTLTGTSAYENIPKVAFNAGATVTIKLAGRDLDALANSREYVARWATDAVPDNSVTFVLEEATAETYKLIRNNTGLKIRRILGTQMIIR